MAVKWGDDREASRDLSPKGPAAEGTEAPNNCGACRFWGTGEGASLGFCLRGSEPGRTDGASSPCQHFCER